MIFVTVGHQMPFDRMVRAVDAWAKMNERNDVFAQIGVTEYVPEHIKWAASVSPTDFRQRISQADLVIAHAGTGTILTAMELGTPILVMPRRGAFQETRNDHQVATAEKFLMMGRLNVAMDELELPKILGQMSKLTAGSQISLEASPQLIQALSKFIHQDNK